MPSSISNSKTQSWGKSWILAVVRTLLVLGSLEIIWRVDGHQPAIIDDQRLWAMERSRIGNSQREIALLGSSRMQTDISIATLHRLAPDHSIVNLSADGTCATAVLRDLAEDKIFKGTVIIETTSECLIFNDTPLLSQQFYVDYYHSASKSKSDHRDIFTESITIIDPYLNLIKVIGDKILKNK